MPSLVLLVRSYYLDSHTREILTYMGGSIIYTAFYIQYLKS